MLFPHNTSRAHLPSCLVLNTVVFFLTTIVFAQPVHAKVFNYAVSVGEHRIIRVRLDYVRL